MNMFIYKPRELMVSSYLAIYVYHHISLSWSQATILRSNKAKKDLYEKWSGFKENQAACSVFCFFHFG